jgi:hypothetical protein
MSDKSGKFSYGFTYSRDDSDWVDGFNTDGSTYTTATKNVVYTDCTPWTTVLEDFLTFLGSCYGYDIRNQVEFSSIYERAAKFNTEDDDWKDDDDTPSNS